MYIVESYSIAILFCIITMFCWGSWANTQKLSGKAWPFQLFYWDYVIGIVLTTLLLAFTMGSFGTSGRGFIEDLSQAEMSSLGLAFLGGIIFNLANLLLVIAIDLTGMAIAFPIGIGIALIQGVLLNYLNKPEGDPILIFGGVTLVSLAIILDAIAYKKVSTVEKKTPLKGILISLAAGILMGFFYKYVAQSMAADFSVPEAGKLTPYTALVIFSIGVFISNFVFNTVNMYKPISGIKVTYSQYFKTGSLKLHSIGMLGGLIWGIGMSFNIIASAVASPAIAYGLGQGATMIAALWGVFVWKEFKNGPKGTNLLLTFMFILFILGLALLILAK
ncbi:MAG TPA: multidrug DMT transporter permease [Saprospirales bacterium]|nr:multidrug DMT transporter permease [Saprospirales bacterium]HAY72163.1 multidrug DMT transporter permease [Saprospirales bacterium]HCR52816.1 multidrug DMT transporter permease [Cytophagales bacterium]HRQ31202.1 GRP family sugar transporter [Saprospiraceae bacterium]